MNIKQEVQEYLSYLEQEAKSPVTIRQYNFVLQKFVSQSEDISKVTVKEFYQTFIAGKSPATRRQYYAVLNSFMEWLLEESLLEENPLKRNKIPKTKLHPAQVLYIPEVDLERIKKQISTLPITLKIAYTIMREGGLRASEVCDLNIDSVHFTGRGIELLVRGKGSKTRVLPFYKTTDTYKLLKKYITTQNPMYPLLVNTVGKRVTYSDLEYAWGAKVSTQYNMHRLRHSKGKDMIASGVPLEVAQEWFGHSDIGTTRRYAAITRNVSNLAIEKYQKA